MSRTITYPSAVMQGPPPIRLETPETWEQLWVPDTLIAVRAPDEGTGDFLANIVIRYYQRMAPFGGDEIKAELDDFLKERQDGELGPLKSQEVDGREFLGADVAYVEGQAGTIGQVHWFTAQQSNDVMDIIQVTGSYGGARRDPDYGTIDQIIATLKINP